MAYVKEIATAVGTLAFAAGIGMLMQSSETAAQRYGDDAQAVSPAVKAAPQADDAAAAAQDGPMLEMDAITLTSALDESSPAPVGSEAEVVLALAPVVELPEPDVSDIAPGQSCDITATAKPANLAMIDLSVVAPCLPNERVTVHHNGMMVTMTTAADGSLDMQVPALSEDSVIIAAFANGEGAVAQTPVPDMAEFDRVVLQWKGRSGFEIHAREFGADYGQKGHVWVGEPGTTEATAAGQSGFIMRLGDASAAEPLMADVYTYPSATSTREGEIDLSVEAEVNLFNCGLDIEAQSLELRDGVIKTQDLTMSVPECDTIGSFLVLNNLIQDLKVASK